MCVTGSNTTCSVCKPGYALTTSKTCELVSVLKPIYNNGFVGCWAGKNVDGLPSTNILGEAPMYYSRFRNMTATANAKFFMVSRWGLNTGYGIYNDAWLEIWGAPDPDMANCREAGSPRLADFPGDNPPYPSGSNREFRKDNGPLIYAVYMLGGWVWGGQVITHSICMATRDFQWSLFFLWDTLSNSHP